MKRDVQELKQGERDLSKWLDVSEFSELLNNNDGPTGVSMEWAIDRCDQKEGRQ